MNNLRTFNDDLRVVSNAFGNKFLGVEITWGLIPEATFVFDGSFVRYKHLALLALLAPSIHARFRVSFETVVIDSLDL